MSVASSKKTGTAILLIVLASLMVLTAPASAAEDPAKTDRIEPQANLVELEDEVMCPICGTLLGLSRAPAAERQRVFMRKLISEGKDEREIKDALVAEYGPQVLAKPEEGGISLYAYLIPSLGLILAAVGVLWAGLRWRRSRGKERSTAASGDGSAAVESERLDRDLADYDL